MDRYADIRAALDQTCHALLIDDPDTIRALLAERDALIHDNAGYVEHASKLEAENVRLREALEKLLAGARAETAESWKCNSYHPKLIAGMDVADAALSKRES